MMNSDLRLPAEWENHTHILMAWPHAETDWAPILSEAQECFARIINAITEYEPVILVTPEGTSLPDGINARIVYTPTNDTWARDFGPITVEESGRKKRMLDFKFNGWGLKFAADKDNLVTSTLFGRSDLYRNRLNFVLEGGSIESNGEGTILTTSRCLLSPNRNGEWSRDDIEKYLKEQFGANRIIWLEHGAVSGDDTDSHIDTLARFVSPDTIMYVAPPSDESIADYDELQKMESELKNTGMRLIALPYVGPVYDPDDNSPLPATYANFLITPRAVFVPIYNLPTDSEALNIISDAFPDRVVIGIDCRALIRQHGSLHCVTMQLYQ